MDCFFFTGIIIIIYDARLRSSKLKSKCKHSLFYNQYYWYFFSFFSYGQISFETICNNLGEKIEKIDHETATALSDLIFNIINNWEFTTTANNNIPFIHLYSQHVPGTRSYDLQLGLGHCNWTQRSGWPSLHIHLLHADCCGV